MDALLLLVRQARASWHGGRGDFHMDPAGRLTRRKPGRRRALRLYRASRSFRSACSRALPEGPFSTNILWDRAIAAGGCFGLSTGPVVRRRTPASIAPTEAALSEL